MSLSVTADSSFHWSKPRRAAGPSPAEAVLHFGLKINCVSPIDAFHVTSGVRTRALSFVHRTQACARRGGRSRVVVQRFAARPSGGRIALTVSWLKRAIAWPTEISGRL
jgi:hypothetical protein